MAKNEPEKQGPPLVQGGQGKGPEYVTDAVAIIFMCIVAALGLLGLSYLFRWLVLPTWGPGP